MRTGSPWLVAAVALACAVGWLPARADLLADIEASINRYQNDVDTIDEEAETWQFFLNLVERQGRVLCPVSRESASPLALPVPSGVCQRWIAEALLRGDVSPAQANAMAAEDVRSRTSQYRAELRKSLAELEARREKAKAMLAYFLDQRDRLKNRPGVAQTAPSPGHAPPQQAATAGSLTGTYTCPGLGRMWFTLSGGQVTGGYSWSGGGKVVGRLEGHAIVGQWKDHVGAGDTNYRFEPDWMAFQHLWRGTGATTWSDAGRCTRIDTVARPE